MLQSKILFVDRGVVMKIIIFGASGMIGQALVTALKQEYQLIVVGRDKDKLRHIFGEIECLTWNDIQERGTEILSSCDLVINLAGENIAAKRWTPDQKRRILESRVAATKKIAEICAQLGDRSPRIMNANGVGIYGLQKTIKAQNDVIYDEDSVLPEEPCDFLAAVGKAWEKALDPAEKAGVKVVKLRFGAVLSKNGGALKKMLPPFRLGMGSVLGSGKQPFPWVALEDLVRAFLFLVERPDVIGPVNVVADELLSQKQFAMTLADVLHRPCFLVMPAWLVKILFGEMSEALLLNGQCVKSKCLLQLGFQFQYPKLKQALEAML